MDVDEDDDFYAPEEATPVTQEQPATANAAETAPQIEQGELEEGEEEDDEEDDDSDIDIITERKDGTKAAPPSQARYNEIRNIPQRAISSDVPAKPAPIKKETNAKGASSSSAELHPVQTSKIDIDAKPIYEPAGKPITQVNIDEDLQENEKPWRRPGTDISDYFNYGFDEFTWALYAAKQDSLRAEYPADTQKKMMDEMNMMMGVLPGMPTAGTGAPAMPGMAGMPGMDGMPPEMQQMMQQMMASGMDPSQMDPAAMFAGMAGAAGPAAGAGQAGQQGFGNQQGFGQGQGYGYDQGMGGNRGNFRGRGRGRNW